jgi:hypothetical protein
MSEAAVKRMTLAEFLRWEDGTDTRYELLAGQPVAMAPPAPPHGFLPPGSVRGSKAPSNLVVLVWCKSKRVSRGQIGMIPVTWQIWR